MMTHTNTLIYTHTYTHTHTHTHTTERPLIDLLSERKHAERDLAYKLLFRAALLRCVGWETHDYPSF